MTRLLRVGVLTLIVLAAAVAWSFLRVENKPAPPMTANESKLLTSIQHWQTECTGLLASEDISMKEILHVQFHSEIARRSFSEHPLVIENQKNLIKCVTKLVELLDVPIYQQGAPSNNSFKPSPLRGLVQVL